MRWPGLPFPLPLPLPLLPGPSFDDRCTSELLLLATWLSSSQVSKSPSGRSHRWMEDWGDWDPPLQTTPQSVGDSVDMLTDHMMYCTEYVFCVCIDHVWR